MSNETIMLAKNLNLKKIQYPCVASEKLDGVPGDFVTHQMGTIFKVQALTRQGEDIKSVDHIRNWLYGQMERDTHLVGELHVQGLPFKDIGGLVRDTKRQHPQLVLNIFDYWNENDPDQTYASRMESLVMSDIGRFIYDDMDGCVRIIPGTTINNEDELLAHCKTFTEANPESEGLIFRPLHGKDSLYRIGKRSWGFQRYKAEETADLRLIDFEEAIEGDSGVGKKMAGRLICEYKGGRIGVGPGALKHDERIAIYNNPSEFMQRIIEVAYKPDPSYDALREARFKRWRDDKSEPNIE